MRGLGRDLEGFRAYVLENSCGFSQQRGRPHLQSECGDGRKGRHGRPFLRVSAHLAEALLDEAVDHLHRVLRKAHMLENEEPELGLPPLPPIAPSLIIVPRIGQDISSRKGDLRPKRL